MIRTENRRFQFLENYLDKDVYIVSALFEFKEWSYLRLETFFSVSEQTELFLLSVILGAGLGILYDCFRVVRIIFPPAKKAGAVCLLDIIFWLCYGFAVFLYSVLLGRGQVRFFYFFGSAAGFILYLISIGNLITGIIRKVVEFIYNTLQRVYSIVIAPIVKIMNFFRQKVLPVFVRNHKVNKKERISTFYPLKRQALLLYNKKAEKKKIKNINV